MRSRHLLATPPALPPPATLPVLLAVAGCGSSASSSSDGTSSSSSSASSSSAGGVGLAVQAKEFSFSPATLNAEAGKVKVTLKSGGQAPHELVLLKTNTAADKLPVVNGRAKTTGEQGEID